MRRFFSPVGLFQSFVALVLIGLCLIAGQWQFHKGQTRANQNSIITKNQSHPAVDEANIANGDPIANQWRLMKLDGRFLPGHELLLRNRYFEGRYGFEVLDLFSATSGKNYWIDRGWVKAGVAANIAPIVPALIYDPTSLVVRIRADDISRQVEGSLFALPGTKRVTVDLSNVQKMPALPYYVDLISSENPKISPLTSITLPDLTGGPHFAYALQWLAFACLILVGRILLFRETK